MEKNWEINILKHLINLLNDNVQFGIVRLTEFLSLTALTLFILKQIQTKQQSQSHGTDYPELLTVSPSLFSHSSSQRIQKSLSGWTFVKAF